MSTVTDLRGCLRSRIPSELRWLSDQIRPFLAWHVVSFLSISAGSLLALFTPLILRWLIDAIIPGRKVELLGIAVLLIFLCHQGRIALTSLGSYVMFCATLRMAMNLRLHLLQHLDTLSAEYYEDTPVGAAMYPLKEPIDEISIFGSDLLPAILRILLTTGMTITTMFVLSPMLTLVVAPLVPLFLATRQYFRQKLVTESDAAQCHRMAWANFLQEHLASAISVQLLAQEKRQERRAFRLLAFGLRSQLRVYKTSTWFNTCSSLAVVAAMSTIIEYGGRSVLAGTLSIGSLVAFYGFVTQLFDPLTGASEIYARAQKTFASIRQVQSTLALRASVANAPNWVLLSNAHPKIEFTGVEFKYRRQKQLLYVPSLQILAGEHIAIAGENGSGKSTLTKLIARLYDPTSGLIQLGGEDIRNIELKNLHRLVCYLQREAVLFEGTLASNLRFVRPAAIEADLEEVIESVGLSRLIRSLPAGLRQRIGPGGCQLSGGERQRVAIARALLHRPEVLILDEATSCLDPSGELMVLQYLREKLSTAILITVTHRPATLKLFQRALVLAGGRIVHDGDHDSFLMAQRARSTPRISTA